MSKASLAALVLVWLGLIGCGGAGKASSSTSKATTSPVTYDHDDAPIRFFGHEASGAERRAIVATLTSYYALAARDDGAGACRLLHALVAETIVEDYGETPTLRGGDCAVVMSKLFAQHHAELVQDNATLEAISVRVEGSRALVLLRFAKAQQPEYIQVSREGGAWKVWDLLAAHMP